MSVYRYVLFKCGIGYLVNKYAYVSVQVAIYDICCVFFNVAKYLQALMYAFFYSCYFSREDCISTHAYLDH